MSSARSYFDRLARRYGQKKYLTSDPVQFPNQYQERLDQEAVGLLAAMLAYGKASIVIQSVSTALERIQGLSTSPTNFVENLQKAWFRKKAKHRFQGWKHRFNTGEDVVHLLYLLSLSWKKYGSLQAHFYHYSKIEKSFEKNLSQVICDWKSWIKRCDHADSVYYFLTDPNDGSACKRWCMFLKWMVRRGFPDCGTWSKNSPFSESMLIYPVDTHVGRLSRYMGFSDQKTVNWKFAKKITNEFKKVHSEDPTRYDFALSRLGILGVCQKRYEKEICQKCEIFSLCRFAKKQMKEVV